MIHIYSANEQPATRYMVDVIDPPFECTSAPHSLIWCGCCGKRRLAKNVVVQVYYDCTDYWCAPGKGCKDPEYIEQQRRRKFRNRSRGQKRRWNKARKEGLL